MKHKFYKFAIGKLAALQRVPAVRFAPQKKASPCPPLFLQENFCYNKNIEKNMPGEPPGQMEGNGGPPGKQGWGAVPEQEKTTWQ